MKKRRILFIGNFLSKKKGTINPSEVIIKKLIEAGYDIIKASERSNQIIRLFEIVMKVIFCKYSILHIDVFSGRAFLFTYYSVIIGSLRNKYIILNLHGGKLPEYFESNKRPIHRIFQKANLIQSPSLYLKGFFENQGYTVSYLPNPIDLSLFPYDRSQVKPYSLLWVRAFTTIYNPEVPVMILEKLLKVYPDATLTMIGPDKGGLPKVKKLVEDLKLSPKVKIVGPIPNNQLYKFYQTHHVYLNTTSYESFGVATVEAAACGIPVVSNKVGEIPFIWEDNSTIQLVNENNIEEFIIKISILFNDKGYSYSISKKARKTAINFSWEKVNFQWIKLLSI